MDSGSANSSSRPIKRGRGQGGAGTSLSSSGRGRGGGAGSTSFKRKLAGTPLFRPEDDSDAAGASEDSGEELPDIKNVFPEGSKAGQARPTSNLRPSATNSKKLAKDDTLYDSGAEAARKTRFEVVSSQNRYMQLKPLREKERREAIAAGLIPDPLKPRKLDEAIHFHAACMEMCPEFEREEREYQKNVDRWEMSPGTSRIDPERAVKAFHRPAAGNEQPLPSDVRPPKVLKKTLDYLFHDIVSQDPSLAESHPFLRDRTRAIRQDFTVQNDRGHLAIECHERIARYHILSLHVLRESETFSENQELEQLRKVLQSLNEFYEDARHEGIQCPHEAEFRAYYLITHLRDSDTIRQAELLPREIFNSMHFQAALRLHALAQRNNETRGERGRRPANSEASLNAFTRFFKAVASDASSYLLACLAESQFVDIRRGALSCLRKAYMSQHAHYPITKLARMLGCDDVLQCAEVAENFGFTVVNGAHGLPISVELHKGAAMQEYPSVVKQRASRTIVEAKRGNASYQSVIDGDFYSSHVDLPATRKQHAKRPSLATRSEKPASPKTATRPATTFPSAKFPAATTPPISLPPSPSVSQNKTPLAPTSKGLNAAASAFTPAFSPKPTTPAEPASTSFNTAVRPLKSEASLSQMPKPAQNRQVGHETEPLASPRTIVSSGKAVSPTQGSSSASASLATSRAPNRATADSTGIAEKLTSQLWAALLDDCLSLLIRNAAADGLSQLHAEEQAAIQSEQTRVIDECAGDLLEEMLDQASRQYARQIAIECQCNQRRLRNALQSWRARLTRVRATQRAKAERKRDFEGLASALGPSPTKSRSSLSTVGITMEASLSEASRDTAELGILPYVDEEFSLADSCFGAHTSRSNTSLQSKSSDAFWAADSLAVLICDLVNRTFSTFHSAKPLEWKAVILVPSLTSNIAAWYRHKLGMSNLDEQRADRMPHVTVEFTLYTSDDIDKEAFTNAGLVIINRDQHYNAAVEARAIQSAVQRDSQYTAPILFADWSQGLENPSSPASRCLIDTADTNGGLAEMLKTACGSVHPSNSVGSRLSAEQIASAFLQIWRVASQAWLAAVSDDSDSDATVHLVELFINSLRSVTTHIEPFLYIEDGKNPRQLPDPSNAADGPLPSFISQYLSADTFDESIQLGFLRAEIDRLDPTSLIRQLQDGLADFMLDGLSTLAVDREASLSDLQTALTWWKEAIEDATAEAVDAFIKEDALNRRKRQKLTRKVDTGRSLTKEKFAKLAPSEKRGVDADSAWIPDRLSALRALVEQTRSVLGTL